MLPRLVIPANANKTIDCGPGNVVGQVIKATYGQSQGFCATMDVDSYIRAVCQGRQACVLAPSNELLNPPAGPAWCPSNRTLVVEYRWGSAQTSLCV